MTIDPWQAEGLVRCMEPNPRQNLRNLTELAFGGGTPRKAAMTALVVGTVLVGINHADAILAGEPISLHKILLTYCVPYLVATWGAISGKKSVRNNDR